MPCHTGWSWRFPWRKRRMALGANANLRKANLGVRYKRVRKQNWQSSEKKGGVEKMKVRRSVFRMALGVITATAVCFGVYGSAACAQNTSTSTGSTAGAAPAPNLPYGAGEVVKMYQGGISKEVIINYINNSSLPFHLGADQLLHLQLLG